MKKFRKFNCLWFGLALGLSVLKKCCVEAHKLDKITGLKPPFIVMKNHMSLRDPLEMNYCIPGGVQYVV